MVDHGYIRSGKYRRKFDLISENTTLNRLLYQLAKKMLFHRSGTLYEDMYWINPETLKIVAKETNQNVEKGILYSDQTKKMICKYERLITLHSHPNSFPPSIADLISNYENNYEIGIVICHDGGIYLYRVNEKIEKKYYELTVADYLNQGYNDIEAQRLALNELMEKFDMECKEVTEYGV